MRATTISSSVALLIASANASPFFWPFVDFPSNVNPRAAQNSGSAFQISNLNIVTQQAENTTITFDAYDPDPQAKTTAQCSGSWKAGSNGYPSGGIPVICGKTNFGWSMASWTSEQEFTLALQDEFTDPSVGQAPYDSVTNFAKVAFNSTNIVCEGTGDISCVQTAPIVNAPVYATSA